MQTLKRLSATALLSLAGLASACSSSQPAAPPNQQAAAPKAMTPEDRVKWYQDCWNDFNTEKWDDFKKCYADNAQSQQLGYGKPTASGPDAIVASSQDFKKAFPDGRGDAQLILVNGPHITSVYLLKGDNTGPMVAPDGKQMPATNKKFGLLFGHSIDMDETAPKVVKETGIMDGGTMANQLGLSPAPARPVMENGESSPKIVIAKNDDMEMKNLEADKTTMDAWNKHDLKGVQMYEADDLVFHDMTRPKDMNRAENDADAQNFWKAFSDAKLNASSMWAAGDYVSIVGTFDGTNDGDYPALKLKKTGKKVSLPFMEIDRFDGGKLKEAWVFFDGAMFASQLGLIGAN